MQAIGILETRGLLAAIEALDAMLKTAEVHLTERTFVGGGLVCLTIEGDVAAVQASIASGRSAVEYLGTNLLKSTHVIPRPDESIQLLFTDLTKETQIEAEVNPDNAVSEAEEPVVAPPEVKAPTQNPPLDFTKEIDVSSADSMLQSVKTYGVKAVLQVLAKKRVVDLRNIARMFEDFPILGRDISMAKKAQLLELFESYLSGFRE